MIKITKENYFNPDTKALHQSSIKSYFLCPNYFYRKEVLHTVEQKESKAFDIGHAVDDILTETDSVDNYAIFEGDRRTKDGKAEYQALVDAGKKVISQKDYDTILEIVDSIEKTTAYREIFKSYNRQEIIQMPIDSGEHFDSIVGEMDFFMIDENNVCHLNDMKTTRSIDDNKFYYAAKEYGYFFQLFVYSILLKYKYPEIKSFEYSILAGETAEPYRVKYFKIPSQYVEAEADRYLYAINSIKAGMFDKEDASIKNPTLLCAPSDRADLINNNEF
jgi:hypothetical protein